MSVYTFRINDSTECRVGWDGPLQTFFGQVYPIDPDGERQDDPETGEPATILWAGTSHGEIRTVDELAARLHPHATLPAETRRALYYIEVD